MPWTCLPGEPPNVNWCNGAGGADLYRNPPEAWRGANTRGEQQLHSQSPPCVSAKDVLPIKKHVAQPNQSNCVALQACPTTPSKS